MSSLFLNLACVAHADDGLGVMEKFSKAVEAEEKNPTKQPVLADLFANYPVLSFSSKFDAHVRCATLSQLGNEHGLIDKADAERIAYAHVSAIVYGATTPEENEKVNTVPSSMFNAAMIYVVGGAEEAFKKEFPACLKYVDKVPSA